MMKFLRQLSLLACFIMLGCTPDGIRHQDELKVLFDKLSAEDNLVLQEDAFLLEFWRQEYDDDGNNTDNRYELDLILHEIDNGESDEGFELVLSFPGENRKPGERFIQDGYYGDINGLKVVRCICIPIVNDEQPRNAFYAIRDVVVKVEGDSYTGYFHYQEKEGDPVRTFGFSGGHSEEGFMAALTTESYTFPATTSVTAVWDRYKSNYDMLRITLDSREEGKIGAIWTIKLVLGRHGELHAIDEITGTYESKSLVTGEGRFWYIDTMNPDYIMLYSPYLEMNMTPVNLNFMELNWSIDIIEDPSTGELFLSGTIKDAYSPTPPEYFSLNVVIDHLKLPVEGLAE